MRPALSATAFYALSILLAPVTVLGFAIWIGKLATTGRRSGVSTSAQGPLSARSTEHLLGTRPDEAAWRLLRVLPGVPRAGLWLTTWPMVLAHRLTGFVPKTFRYPFEGDVPPQSEASARIEFFDAAFDRYLAQMEQVVLLGAGFDTRAYRPHDGHQARVFEVDQPDTLAVKRQTLQAAGIDAAGVTFVPADFGREDWLSRLVQAGLDPERPAFFLWEGVTMYLDREAVDDTLRKIGGCAPGSVLAFDYFTSECLESKAFYWRFARMSTKAGGEPLGFGVDARPPTSERLAELVGPFGFEVVEQRVLGREDDGHRAWGGFATAKVIGVRM